MEHFYSLGPEATPYLNVTIPVLQGVVSYTRVFSPHIINQSRIGLSRENIQSYEIGVQNTAQQFGIPNVNVDELTKGLPIIVVPGVVTTVELGPSVTYPGRA